MLLTALAAKMSLVVQSIIFQQEPNLNKAMTVVSPRLRCLVLFSRPLYLMLSSPSCVLQAYNNSRDFMMNLWDLTEVCGPPLPADDDAQHDCSLPLLTCRTRQYPQWTLESIFRSHRC